MSLYGHQEKLGCPILRAFAKGGMKIARTTIPHHKSGCPIFATAPSSLRWASCEARPSFLRTDHTLKAAGAEVADNPCLFGNYTRGPVEPTVFENQLWGNDPFRRRGDFEARHWPQ